MHGDGLKMVIQIKPNEVMKYMDDEGTSSRRWAGCATGSPTGSARNAASFD